MQLEFTPEQFQQFTAAFWVGSEDCPSDAGFQDDIININAAIRKASADLEASSDVQTVVVDIFPSSVKCALTCFEVGAEDDENLSDASWHAIKSVLDNANNQVFAYSPR